MKIFFVNSLPVYLHGLPWGLTQLGHQVRAIKEIHRDYFNRYMEMFQPDLIITAGWINQYVPENLEIMKEAARRHGCLHAYWATEDVNYLTRWSLPMVRQAQPDAVFTINADCVAAYRSLGIPAWHLDFGYSPVFEPIEASYRHDLAIVANTYDIWRETGCFRYKSMDILIRPLIEKGYDIVFWGSGWEECPWLANRSDKKERCLGWLDFKETFWAFKSARIIINLQNQNQFPTQVTSRTFEILGAGGFQLTARTKAVERLFKHRRHLVMSSSPAETLELVDYYLAHDSERRAVAARGRAEVMWKHTYAQRASQMLESLETLKKRKKPATKAVDLKSPNLYMRLLQPPAADGDVFESLPRNYRRDESVLTIGRVWQEPKGWSTARGYLSFDLSSLPADADVESAVLSLWLNWKGPVACDVGCWPIREDWSETTLSWANQPACAEEPAASVKVEGNSPSLWLTWDITELVRKWQRGEQQNYGLCLRCLNEKVQGATIMTLASRHWSGSNRHTPNINIIYFSKTQDQCLLVE